MFTARPMLRAFGNRQRVLVTERLVLRPPRHADADVLARQFSDPEVTRMQLHAPTIHGRKEAACWVAGMRAGIRDGHARFYVIEQDSMPIGIAGLTNLDSGIAEFGYWIGRAWWGKGFMSEAAPPILRAAWQISTLEAIEAAHTADNEASGRLLVRCGFRYTGTIKLYSWTRGMNVVGRTMLLDRPVSLHNLSARTAA